MAIPFCIPSPRLALAFILGGAALTSQAAPLSQPVAPVRPVTGTYFRTPVVDPYRWMENLKSPEVQSWMKAQNDYTRDYLSHLPGRDALIERVKALDNASTRVGDLGIFGSRYFYYKITPQDQTPKLYARDGLTGEERLLADPQVMGGPQVVKGVAQRYTIGDFYPSPDGRLVAVEIAAGGAEEGTLRVIDAANGKVLADSIDRVWGASVSWDPSDTFFYYTRLQKLGPNDSPLNKELDEASYLHHLGDDPAKDVVVLSRKTNPELGMIPTDSAYVSVTPGSPYLLGIVSHGVKNELTLAISPTLASSVESPLGYVLVGTTWLLCLICILIGFYLYRSKRKSWWLLVAVAFAFALIAEMPNVSHKGAPVWTKFVDVDDDVTSGAIMGREMWLMTHKDAPRFKVLHIDLDHPDIAKADVALPQSDLVLQGISTAKDALYIEAAQGGISHLLRIPYDPFYVLRTPMKTTPISEVALPFAGAIEGFFTDVQQDGALMRLAGWTEAPQWYAYDPATDKLTNTHVEALNPTDFSGITSVEVTAPAADGTPVPLSIIYRKDLPLNGQNPCLMEGYGAYGISLDPNFDATRLALLEKGIVIAYPHVRGGGENGEDWHLAGQKLTKQNTIGDFIACAEYLIKQGYTSPSKLAGRGTSAGGITIGGALTQRPDLFTLCICNVGVMDTLRLEAGPNGAVNTPEFGSVKDPDGFKALFAMDAYQHVKDGTAYPAVLLITGANDPRVDPWELFKMTARLQAATSSKNPILLRIDYDAGHGMGSSKTQRDLITADEAALLLSRAAMATPPSPQK